MLTSRIKYVSSKITGFFCLYQDVYVSQVLLSKREYIKKYNNNKICDISLTSRNKWPNIIIASVNEPLKMKSIIKTAALFCSIISFLNFYTVNLKS